jgi:hypothetical protein
MHPPQVFPTSAWMRPMARARLQAPRRPAARHRCISAVLTVVVAAVRRAAAADACDWPPARRGASALR